jgi:hypothetical protein
METAAFVHNMHEHKCSHKRNCWNIEKTALLNIVESGTENLVIYAIDGKLSQIDFLLPEKITSNKHWNVGKFRFPSLEENSISVYFRDGCLCKFYIDSEDKDAIIYGILINHKIIK